jgi:predicted ATPase with chaperone activity
MAESISLAADQVGLSFSDFIFLGKLGLGGSMRAKQDIIGKLLAARELSRSNIVIPRDNLAQAALLPTP